jgi:hypothetical protein
MSKKWRVEKKLTVKKYKYEGSKRVEHYALHTGQQNERL